MSVETIEIPATVRAQAQAALDELLQVAEPLWRACRAYADLTTAVEVLASDYWDDVEDDIEEWSQRIIDVRGAAGIEDLYAVLSAFVWFIEQTARADASTTSPRTLLELQQRFKA